MIVRDAVPPALLITQPDHAAVSAAIMRQWVAGGLQQSPRRAEILLAIGQHDNGWAEVDAAPVLDGSGRILDFVHAPEEMRHDVWRRGVARLEGEPYAAALVAQHALHVYRRMRQQAGWAGFFADLTAARDRHLRTAHETVDTLRREYVFLRLGDLASLTFCGVETAGQANEMGYDIVLREMRLVVTPDPFAGTRVPLEVQGRAIASTTFASAADASAAWEAAPIRTLAGVAQGP
jgi:hypothetical protein